jgi:prolyl 4-hydroxylase
MSIAQIITDTVACYDDFLSAEECQGILEELDIAFWQPSKVIRLKDDDKYSEELSSMRVSHTAAQEWFSKKLMAVLKKIEKRICRLHQTPANHLEYWQATKYPFRGKFDYHHDAGYWDLHPAGERVRTFLLYLDTPKKGGETHFRALDISVDARAGRLLTWDNLFANGDCNHRMVHSGKPLLKGSKTTLVTWERQKKFRIPLLTKAGRAK